MGKLKYPDVILSDMYRELAKKASCPNCPFVDINVGRGVVSDLPCLIFDLICDFVIGFDVENSGMSWVRRQDYKSVVCGIGKRPNINRNISNTSVSIDSQASKRRGFDARVKLGDHAIRLLTAGYEKAGV